MEISFEKIRIQGSPWRHKSIMRHLNVDELAYLEENAKINHYVMGETIFLQGKYIDGCYLVLSGIVKQFKTGKTGRNYILRLSHPFNILGYRSVLNNEPACNTSKVLVDSTVCYIPKECLYHLIKTNGDFALDLLQIACGELEETHSMITDITMKSQRALLAELLLTLQNKFGVDDSGYMKIMLTHEDYAGIIGSSSSEAMSRMISEFKAKQYINKNKSGRKIIILNEDALEKIATTTV